MSERDAATTDVRDWEELEARRRRRRSEYFGQQRAGPPQIVQPSPPTPKRSEISREEFWAALDRDSESGPPQTPSTGPSEASSRLQRIRGKWTALKEAFGA
ncbi:uncharacterized protein RCC_03681 [Ramularia collo-cygni]|uniref:Uncharacterized protein n=1 Tax=Ramularia collo-cygni TaxID=112498 RepID=A0A2D3UUR2_9PEZI|nr:uncharacterized protein RCC_03681 [Ramularia collo-cygni]CZT17845.1 uncharacterized protein RCC_03681 [Ramularia collo-cygni]